VAKKQQKGPEALEKFLQGHPVPVVLGPGQKRYLIDHHHLCSALHKMGVESCYAGTELFIFDMAFCVQQYSRFPHKSQLYLQRAQCWQP
jgi:hypothetical protein